MVGEGQYIFPSENKAYEANCVCNICFVGVRKKKFLKAGVHFMDELEFNWIS